jgi:hypothetical protein|tara:strand:- start:546 stop:773 length:228 start_codon:yes stop_codon:yes gene_type:complete
MEALLLEWGPPGLGLLALGKLYLDERKDRKEAQAALQTALREHGEAMLMVTKDVTGSLDAMRHAISRQSRGRDDG